MADFSYIGAGQVYLREVGAAAGFEFIGNVSALSLAIQQEEKELKDFTKGGGGAYNSVNRISAVEASMTLHDLSAANLARVVYGSSSAIAAGTVTNEALGNVYRDCIAPTANPIDTTVAPTVQHTQYAAAARANTTAYALNAYVLPATPNGYIYKATTAGTSGGTIPTYPTTLGGTVTDGTVVWTCVGKTALVVDVDYTVGPAGITFTSTGINNGEPAQVSYTRKAGNAVEALTSSGKEYEILFAGVNDARSGAAFNVRAYRFKPSPAQNIALIGDDYAALEVTGKLIKDSSKTGAGISQYFKAQIVT
jgi:hypothetical protein